MTARQAIPALEGDYRVYNWYTGEVDEKKPKLFNNLKMTISVFAQFHFGSIGFDT